MVVNDSREILEVFEEILTEEGYEVDLYRARVTPRPAAVHACRRLMRLSKFPVCCYNHSGPAARRRCF